MSDLVGIPEDKIYCDMAHMYLDYETQKIKLISPIFNKEKFLSAEKTKFSDFFLHF